MQALRVFLVCLVVLSTVHLSTAARPAPTARKPLQIPEQVFLPERVFFDPNAGEPNKIEDYLGNVYIGIVDVAEADPTLAAAGGAAGAGLGFTYDKSSYFDYETPNSRANIGPSAHAVGAAVARVLGGGGTKAIGRASAKTQGAYSRNAFDRNNIAIGTTSELAAGASAGGYLDRTSGNDNDALLAQTPVPQTFFGH